MGINAAQSPQAEQKPHQALYAAQLLESLSDVVDTLNEALADEFIFIFQMSQTSDGKFALTTLNCTIPMLPAALAS